MKKTLLFLLLICSLSSYSQFFEGFENTNGPDALPSTNWTLSSGNWMIVDNGVGNAVRWGFTNTVATPPMVYQGSNAAYVGTENIGQGNTSEDYLITPGIHVPANGQLHFYTRSFTNGDQGTLYQIKIAPASSDQSVTQNYTLIQQWSETELNTTFNIYQEKVVDLTSHSGEDVYIAFVKVNTQTTTTTSGDRWMIDDVSVNSGTINPTPGISCNNPIQITALPYSTTNDTANFSDNATIEGSPGSSGCGSTNSYLNGNDVVYAYTATTTGTINVMMTPTATYSGIFVYTDCANIGTACVNGVANAGTTPRTFDLSVTAGQTYYFVISTWAAPQTTGYTLVLQPFTCPAPTTLAVSGITSTSVQLSWANLGNANSWEVVVQAAGSPTPTGPGVTANTNTSYLVSNLTPGTAYQYYVRADCGNGTFSSWAGPYAFNTLVAPPICGGTFVDNGGPNGNYANSTDATTTICPTNPGDKVTVTFTSFYTEATWDALYIFDGNSISAPQIVSTNAAGNVPGGLAGGFWGNLTGTALPGPFTSTSADGCLTFRFRSDTTINNPGWIANVTCAPPPTCPKPTALTTTNITATSVTLGWTNNSNATSWEYYLAVNGTPEPTVSTTGVAVTTNPVTITGLTPNTCYNFYVRAICSETDSSIWSVGANFCSLLTPPTCGGQFVDNGGPNANYADNSDNTYTICPTNPGEIVTVVFTSFDTEATWDALYVYDGNSISSPQIASNNPASNVPGGVAGGYWGTTLPGPFTSSSPDGCLTFRFRSDNTVNRGGWTANVICAPDSDKIMLVAFVDANGNGIKDTNENLFTGGSFVYQQNNDGINVEAYSPTGRYPIYDTANSYDFSYQMQTEYTPYFSAGTTAYNDISIVPGGGTQVLYFPMTLTQTYSDVVVTIVPVNAPRPSLNYINRIVYRNMGIASASGTLTFAKPAPVTIASISQTGTTTNVSGFTYNFTNLLPNETRTIDVTMTVPATPTVNLNDLLTDTAVISGVANDINSVNNSSSNSQIVVNSYDPNNKMESHGDKIPINQFAAGDYFHYTIRFQNNGTASAINVSIEDYLSPLVDEETVLMESASHSYVMDRVGNHLVWTFKDIYLPSSAVNATSSIGYVEFKVKLKAGFHAGTIVPNNASIYFDTNPAIVTNTFNVKFTQALGTAHFDSQSLVVYPNPASSIVQINLIDSTERINKVTLFDLLGKEVSNVTANAVDHISLDVSHLSKGVYLMEITSDTNSKLTKKLIIE
ncbi:DUF7619 domain-containing protein [Flavobacterium sp. XGLA_31]|uniref:DUF7619 domain-containing protein n=1 Tax=Flavobacterium sp. XGLA_31 TaxID=3447666 RepID=UPI003F34CE87